MVIYGIVFIYLVKLLKAAYPDITQTWYSENAGSLGMYYNIELYFNFLK